MVGARARRARGNCDRNAVEVATGLEFAPDWNLIIKAWQEQGGASQSAKAEAGISRDFGFLGVGVAWSEEISANSDCLSWISLAAPNQAFVNFPASSIICIV
ncbi:MAG: hypothetical protein IPO30_07440 [Hyphomonadaceae bacterium]|nr:hypothetical protein [Hyphomonadaceae bacterium]